MGKMTKLQTIQENIKNLEAKGFENFTIEDMLYYNTLVEKEATFRTGKMQLLSAPESMNPAKCLSHFSCFSTWLSSTAAKHKIDVKTEVDKEFPNGFQAFVPSYVQDYKNKIRNIICSILNGLE